MWVIHTTWDVEGEIERQGERVVREERYDIGYIDERGDMRGDMIERVEKGERNRGEKREEKGERREERE